MPALDRRALLASLAAAPIATSCAWRRSGARAAAEAEGAHLPRPNRAQLAWQQAELGVVYHWDLHVFDGKRYVQSENRKVREHDLDAFAPEAYDPDQWLAAAKAAGARFALLTASHETGFRLWPSGVNPYSVSALTWRNGQADVVGEFIEACRGAGIAPGLYVGARWNGKLDVLNWRVTEASPLTQAEYNRLIEDEVAELCGRYGPLFELWFDGGILAPEAGGPDVLPIAQALQPDMLFYHSDQRRDVRWGGSESGTVPYPCWSTAQLDQITTESTHPNRYPMLKHGDPNAPAWCPAMSDAPLRGTNGRHEWFWEPGDEGTVNSPEQLVRMREHSNGRNSTLILGLTPDDRGLIPDPDLAALRGFGDAWQARYGEPLASASGVGRRHVLTLPEPRPVQRLRLREDLAHGERVRAYRLLGITAEGQALELDAGSCIGACRLVPVDAPPLAAVELLIDASAATPLLSEFAAFA